MAQFKLSDAVSLFTQYTSIINSLWTVYVAATFAAAGYGISIAHPDRRVASAITIGFWAFTLGNLHLLRRSLAVHRTLADQIRQALKADGDDVDCRFTSSIQAVADTANTVRNPTLIHILIDACVTIALWVRVLS